VDTSIPGKPSCQAALPYPAEERLVWVVTCKVCGLKVGVTAAGRPDDPAQHPHDLQGAPAMSDEDAHAPVRRRTAGR
jgi:hypothetical protein